MNETADLAIFDGDGLVHGGGLGGGGIETLSPGERQLLGEDGEIRIIVRSVEGSAVSGLFGAVAVVRGRRGGRYCGGRCAGDALAGERHDVTDARCGG